PNLTFVQARRAGGGYRSRHETSRFAQRRRSSVRCSLPGEPCPRLQSRLREVSRRVLLAGRSRTTRLSLRDKKRLALMGGASSRGRAGHRPLGKSRVHSRAGGEGETSCPRSLWSSHQSSRCLAYGECDRAISGALRHTGAGNDSSAPLRSVWTSEESTWFALRTSSVGVMGRV